MFSKETILSNLDNCLELTSTELDIVILVNIQASTPEHDDANPGQKRKRHPNSSFTYKSLPICKTMFLQLYGISDFRFRSLKEHYEEKGIAPRIHGNTKKLPSNALSHEHVKDIAAFISNYAEENAIVLPDRVSGYKKNDDIKLLPSSESKANVWRAYKRSCEVTGKKQICYSKFVDMWNSLFPNVVVAKPMTDFCARANKTKQSFNAQQIYLMKRSLPVLSRKRNTLPTPKRNKSIIEKFVVMRKKFLNK